MSSRETSYFSIAKLLQTGLANLKRLHIFWRPLSAHLLEVLFIFSFPIIFIKQFDFELCTHSNASTREWGSIALTQLIKNAMKQTLTLLNEKEMSVNEIAVIF